MQGEKVRIIYIRIKKSIKREEGKDTSENMWMAEFLFGYQFTTSYAE